MPEIELVRSRKGTLGHGHIIYGIQKIGLSLSIIAAYAIDIGRKVNLLKLNVSEISNYYLLKYRHTILYIITYCNPFVFTTPKFKEAHKALIAHYRASCVVARMKAKALGILKVSIKE